MIGFRIWGCGLGTLCPNFSFWIVVGDDGRIVIILLLDIKVRNQIGDLPSGRGDWDERIGYLFKTG